MAELPRGTVTFLFTDIEGSTALWERDRPVMAAAVERHIALLDAAIEAHGGVHFKTVGDAVQAAFPTAPQAVAAALGAQQSLVAEDWGVIGALRVRMALHAGEADPDPRGDYLSAPLNRLSRLLTTGHGGQILLSQTVQQLSRGALPDGVALRDLGEHRLRDLLESERVYQLLHPDLPDQFPPLKTLGSRPNNLPLQPTPFLGREREVGEIVDWLGRPDVRLLTLTGPGGTGKTRLALQAAAEVLEEFADGVYFVPLALVTDPTLVPSTIASALGIREVAEQSVVERLRDVLTPQRLLLVLDNVEHLVEASSFVGDLLGTAPGVKVLATSRLPLRLRAEQEYPVPALSLPNRKPPPTLEQMSHYEAVRLFVDRAQSVKPDFIVDNENAPAVAEICWRLDGLPLAIELASARVRMLSAQSLLARLEKRLPMLTSGARDAPARQRTLRDAIAWSFDLLEPEEQILFRRLAVFVGGCTLEAAEAVMNSDGTLDVFGGMERLGEHSLLRQKEGWGREPRFEMLETVREYGLERLAESGEEEATQDAHAAHFAELGDETVRNYFLRPVPFLATLEAEADNLRAALGWAKDRRDAETGLRLALAFAGLAFGSGLVSEGRGWLERLLSFGGGAPLLRARAFNQLGWLALFQGDTDAAEAAGTQALALTGDGSPTHAESLNLLGSAELDRGPSDAAQHWLEEALALVEGAPDADVSAPPILNNLGLLAVQRHDFKEARRWYEASLGTLPTHGLPFMRPIVIGNLAWLSWEEGDRLQAAQLLRQVLALESELRNRSSLANGLEQAARHAMAVGQSGAVALLLGVAEALRVRAGIAIEPYNLQDHEALLARTRKLLGEATFTAAWIQGEGLTQEQAVAQADALLAEAEQAYSEGGHPP